MPYATPAHRLTFKTPASPNQPTTTFMPNVSHDAADVAVMGAKVQVQLQPAHCHAPEARVREARDDGDVREPSEQYVSHKDGEAEPRQERSGFERTPFLRRQRLRQDERNVGGAEARQGKRNCKGALEFETRAGRQRKEAAQCTCSHLGAEGHGEAVGVAHHVDDVGVVDRSDGETSQRSKVVEEPEAGALKHVEGHEDRRDELDEYHPDDHGPAPPRVAEGANGRAQEDLQDRRRKLGVHVDLRDIHDRFAAVGRHGIDFAMDFARRK
mmetsp:Transcript_895/g.3117  ORF Transcript_895/g.3117 Transcript_895/m.3117 type:complete len:269 (+) Transcript_895:1369-2175(+)